MQTQHLRSKEIIISPENRHFSIINNQFLCSKSDQNIDTFDTLIIPYSISNTTENFLSALPSHLLKVQKLKKSLFHPIHNLKL